MITVGNRPIDIDPLIRGAETAAIITAQIPVEDLIADPQIMRDLYEQLALYGQSIIGKAGLIIAFGDHVIASDHSGTRAISGAPVSLTGRYCGVSSVYTDEPVEFAAGRFTNVVPALDFEVTYLPVSIAGDSGGARQALKFPRVALPLLGQSPLVYEYIHMDSGSGRSNFSNS